MNRLQINRVKIEASWLIPIRGEVLAEGEITQVAHGDKLKTSLVFHFKDTSLYQEDVVFSQRRIFRVFSYHLTQKGPAFKPLLETFIGWLHGRGHGALVCRSGDKIPVELCRRFSCVLSFSRSRAKYLS
jgi:hypothetical protein